MMGCSDEIGSSIISDIGYIVLCAPAVCSDCIELLLLRCEGRALVMKVPTYLLWLDFGFSLMRLPLAELPHMGLLVSPSSETLLSLCGHVATSLGLCACGKQRREYLIAAHATGDYFYIVSAAVT